MTLQAVADAAGVTKGGLLHHFQSRQALLDALFDNELETFEARLIEEMADKPRAYGLFTRAYIEVSLVDGWAGADYAPNALATVMIGDPRMRERWACWLNGMLETYADTDGDERLYLARFASDGYWLADMCQLEKPNKGAMREQLLAMTYGHSPIGA